MRKIIRGIFRVSSILLIGLFISLVGMTADIVLRIYTDVLPWVFIVSGLILLGMKLADKSNKQQTTIEKKTSD